MTCREKLKLGHPDKVRSDHLGGCVGCPVDYGYLDQPNYCIGYINDEKCSTCWDREIPESEDTGDVSDDV